MSSSPTARNGFDKPGYGDQDDLWGIVNLNTDFDLIDESLDGITYVVTTGGTTTLTATDYASNQARKRVLDISGALVSNAVIEIPNVEKWWKVRNRTTGAYTVLVGASGGTGGYITQGSEWEVRNDGVGAGTLTLATPRPNRLPLADANFDINNFKITNLAQATGAGDAVRLDQLPGTPIPRINPLTMFIATS